MTAQSRECPDRTIEPDALARAIAAAHRLKEENPVRYKSLPTEQGKQ